jgi:hypothetical protein
MLIFDGPVSFYQGRNKADGYKRICFLPLANVYFTPVYSTGPSPTVSANVQCTVVTTVLGTEHELCGPYG